MAHCFAAEGCRSINKRIETAQLLQGFHEATILIKFILLQSRNSHEQQNNSATSWKQEIPKGVQCMQGSKKPDLKCGPVKILSLWF